MIPGLHQNKEMSDVKFDRTLATLFGICLNQIMLCSSLTSYSNLTSTYNCDNSMLSNHDLWLQYTRTEHDITSGQPVYTKKKSHSTYTFKGQ